MRYRSDRYHPFQRPITSKKEEPIYKYFLIFEGESTERSYLNSLRGYPKKHPFVMVEKVGNEKGYTVLKKMIELADKINIDPNANRRSYEDVYSDIARELKSDGLKPLSESALSKKLVSIHKSKHKEIPFDAVIEKSVLEEILKEFEKFLDAQPLSVGKQAEELLNYSYPTFTKDFDKIGIIVDRDRQGCSDETFREEVIKGMEKGYRILLTNPDIEFWLLLHHKKDFTKEEKDDLLLGKLPRHSHTVSYELLKNLDRGYTKGFSNSSDYVKKTKVACENAKNFASEPLELVTHLGTCLGEFFGENLDFEPFKG